MERRVSLSLWAEVCFLDPDTNGALGEANSENVYTKFQHAVRMVRMYGDQKLRL